MSKEGGMNFGSVDNSNLSWRDIKMNSTRLGLAFLCFGVFLLCQGVGFADDKAALRKEIMSKGLKVASTEKLFVHVTHNQHPKIKSGLSKKAIQAQVEKQLRQNGITPVGKTDSSYGLFIEVTETPVRTADGVMGFAFSTAVEFQRFVYYRVNGREHAALGNVWEQVGIGINPVGESLPLKIIARDVGAFIKAFKKANTPAAAK